MLAVVDAGSFGAAMGAALAAITIGAICAGYLGLCVYLGARADSSSAAPPPVSAAAPMPFNWLVPAVVAIVLGFTPFAIASLVHAARVAPHQRAGEFEAARDAARRARTWFLWSAAIGAVLIVLFAVGPALALSLR